MSGYINVWRKEHGQIVESLSRVLKLDIFSEAGKKELQELKKTLETHLNSEDRDFYPILKKAAETDPLLKQKLLLFAGDMDKISTEVMAFFRKQTDDPTNKDIPVAFGRISAILKSRISREESLLMKEFEKTASSPGHPTGKIS